MNSTITAINVPSHKIKYGKCKICLLRRVQLTHNVKFENGKVIKICVECSTRPLVGIYAGGPVGTLATQKEGQYMRGKILLAITRPFKPEVTRFEMDEGRVSVGPAFFGRGSISVTAQYDSDLENAYYWIEYHDDSTGKTRLLMKIVNGEITESNLPGGTR
jgi:hypothetical protein